MGGGFPPEIIIPAQAGFQMVHLRGAIERSGVYGFPPARK